MPTPITLEQANDLIKELLSLSLNKGELVKRYERLAYPNGRGKKSPEQEMALKLFSSVPATEEEIRIALSKLIRKGIAYEDLLSLLDGNK